MAKLSLLRKKSKTYLSYGLILLSLVFFTHPSFSQTSPSLKTLKNEYYLFVQTAKTAEIIRDPQNNTYNLILNNVDPSIVYFSNVPRYEADLMNTRRFVSVIEKNISLYHTNGLNAGVVGTVSSKPEIKKYILSLRNPVYNAEKNTMNFSAVMASVNPNTHEKNTDNFPSRIHLKNVSLFIDSVCLSCIQP